MSVHVKKFRAALKHGAFSATTILPGEDPTAFKKTHEDIIAELALDGALEDDIGWTIAHLVWRKRNIATLRIGELLQRREGAGARSMERSTAGDHPRQDRRQGVASQANQARARLSAGTPHGRVQAVHILRHAMGRDS